MRIPAIDATDPSLLRKPLVQQPGVFGGASDILNIMEQLRDPAAHITFPSRLVDAFLLLVWSFLLPRAVGQHRNCGGHGTLLPTPLQTGNPT